MRVLVLEEDMDMVRQQIAISEIADKVELVAATQEQIDAAEAELRDVSWPGPEEHLYELDKIVQAMKEIEFPDLNLRTKNPLLSHKLSSRRGKSHKRGNRRGKR